MADSRGGLWTVPATEAWPTTTRDRLALAGLVAAAAAGIVLALGVALLVAGAGVGLSLRGLRFAAGW